MSIEKKFPHKIVGRLSDEKREAFFRKLYNNSFDVTKKEHTRGQIYEIRTMPLVRREGYYVPCAYLNYDFLELVHFEIEEFKKWDTHKNLVDIYNSIKQTP